MADDLDNFFKSKEKKGKKKQSKIVAGDLLELKKEEEARRAKKKEKKIASEQQMSDILRKTKEDEEWDDFEETTEVNLKNIRITNLADKKLDQNTEEVIKNEVSDSEEKFSDTESQHSDTDTKDKTKNTTVWGTKSDTPTTTVVEPIEPEKAEPVSVSDQPAAPEKYVPPSKRVTGVSGDLSARPLPRRRQQLPDLGNNQDFPTLGTAPLVEKEVHDASWSTAQRNVRDTRPAGGSTYTPSSESSSFKKAEPVEPIKSTPGKYVPPNRRQGGGAVASTKSTDSPLTLSSNRFAKLDNVN